MSEPQPPNPLQEAHFEPLYPLEFLVDTHLQCYNMAGWDFWDIRSAGEIIYLGKTRLVNRAGEPVALWTMEDDVCAGIKSLRHLLEIHAVRWVEEDKDL